MVDAKAGASIMKQSYCRFFVKTLQNGKRNTKNGKRGSLLQ